MKTSGHIHIIGICGVLTSALASAFHQAGWKVTGSDKGFFPPVSTQLEKLGIDFYAGWHPEKMVANGKPDIVVVATASGSQNPETAYAQANGLKIFSPTEIIREYLVAPKSIVCAGTWGKTTSSALLSYILINAGLDPAYMFGGISLSHELSAMMGQKNEWSVLEGDEYKSGPTDNTAKFFYYKPTHLLLTAVSWDHADLYPTESSYIETFKKLLHTVPNPGAPGGGRILTCIDAPLLNTLVNQANLPHITYGKDAQAQYRYEHIRQSKSGLVFDIVHDGKKFEVRSPLLGEYNVENITGCFAMAHEIGLPIEKILSGIAGFQGMKRRLERRLESKVTVIDDIAHSPEKARSVLANIRTIYGNKIYAVFEPNIGGRQRESAGKYDNAFVDADEVIIPRLTKLKIDTNDSIQPMEGEELNKVIARTHKNALYISDDEELVKHLIEKIGTGDTIAFLGSHGFRGMIEEVVKRLKR